MCWYSVILQPGTKAQQRTKVEDMYKNLIEKVKPGLQLIANGTMRTYSSASIAANPM
jgi:hypothetical protein